MTKKRSRPQALDGKLVLDMGQVYNGPYCGLLLTFMGARVLKIEPPGGDTLRRGLPRAEDRSSFLRLNSNKESVVLDLKLDEGKDLLIRLARKADVLIENFKVGVMDRLGIGWETLHEINPRLIYASGKGFGLTGPYRDFPAMDLTVQAMSGILSCTGYADLPPVRAGPAVTDFLGGVHLCTGILAAMVQRERTGEGQLVEVSMHEAAVMAMNTALGGLMDSGPGVLPERTGNRVPNLSIAPYNVYPAKDGDVTIFCVTDRHWRKFAQIMGRPDLGSDPRFATIPDRAGHMDEIDEIVSDWTRGRDRESMMTQLNGAGIPCAPVKTIAEVAADAHLHERGAEVEISHPEKGTIQVPVSPIRLHGSEPASVDRVAPAVGEDTDRVLQDLLGLDGKELERLHACGAIEPRAGQNPG